MTLYTSTVVTPRGARAPGRSSARTPPTRSGCPILLLVIWGLWSSVSPAPFFPSPLVIFEAFVDTWIGPAFFVDVLPSLGRLAIGIVLAIVIGIAAGTLIGLVRWLRELLEPILEFFRAVPPPVLIPIIAVLVGANDAMKIVGHRRGCDLAGAAEHDRGRARDRLGHDRDRPARSRSPAPSGCGSSCCRPRARAS